MLALKYSEFEHECGTDEAGRGCLAGPVTAAAVILPPDYHNSTLNDSKQLSEKKREMLRESIIKEALNFHVAHIFPDEIDKINILNASIKAMHYSIDGIGKVDFIAVDGNKFHSYQNIPHQTIIKGDGKYLHIAAASILAKTSRDEIMKQLDEIHPQYQWKNNKGYPTKMHRSAIEEFGITSHHRKTFRLLPEQLSLDF